MCCYNSGYYIRLFAFFIVSPAKPEEMDWSELYPEFFTPLPKDDHHDDPKDMEERTKPSSQVEFADIGCGYGGLLGNFTPPPPQIILISYAKHLCPVPQPGNWFSGVLRIANMILKFMPIKNNIKTAGKVQNMILL